MNCPKCLQQNFKYHKPYFTQSFQSGVPNGEIAQILNVVSVKCQNCQITFNVTDFVVIQELDRLQKLEKAVNELHYVLSSHPTIQRLSADERDTRIDDAFLKLEGLMNLENSYEQAKIS